MCKTLTIYLQRPWSGSGAFTCQTQLSVKKSQLAI